MASSFFAPESISLLLIAIPRILALVLLGERKREGWMLTSASAVLSIAWAMWTHAPALVAVSVATIFASMRGLKRWDHNEDDLRARLHAANTTITILQGKLDGHA